MIRTHRGRGGWVIEASGVARAAGLAVVILTLALSACASKKAPEAGEGGTSANAGRLGQQGLGGAGGNSLEQYKQGVLGQNGEQGPLGDIHFDYNDYTVRDQDGPVLRANADWLEKNRNTRVQIEGHCDERGSEEYNIALGAKRAQAAKAYLQTLGIASDRMSTISYGKELPICTEHTDDCWAQNRRDHFAVVE